MKAFVLDKTFFNGSDEPRYIFGLRRKPGGGDAFSRLDLVGGRIKRDDPTEILGLCREAEEELQFKLTLQGHDAPVRVGTQMIHWGTPQTHVIRKFWLARLAWNSSVMWDVTDSEEFSKVESLTIPEALDYGLDPSLDEFCRNPDNVGFDTILRELGEVSLSDIGRALILPPVQTFRNPH